MKLFNKVNSKTSQDGVSSPSTFAVEDSRMIYTVSITDNISDVFIYDEVLMLLENAEENDEIIFNIASYGGRLDSLLALRSGILSTKATVIGKLVSHACSEEITLEVIYRLVFIIMMICVNFQQQ